MHTLLGHHADAAAAFNRARTTLEKNGQRPLRAMADYDEALALLRYGRGAPTAETVERVNELIGAAEAGFAALGMGGWEASARDLRAEVDEAAARAGGRKRASLPAGITAREVDILRLVVRGNSDRQIGEDLYLSPRTVNAHIRHMLAKTTLKTGPSFRSGRSNRGWLSASTSLSGHSQSYAIAQQRSGNPLAPRQSNLGAKLRPACSEWAMMRMSLHPDSPNMKAMDRLPYSAAPPH